MYLLWKKTSDEEKVRGWYPRPSDQQHPWCLIDLEWVPFNHIWDLLSFWESGMLLLFWRMLAACVAVKLQQCFDCPTLLVCGGMRLWGGKLCSSDWYCFSWWILKPWPHPVQTASVKQQNPGWTSRGRKTNCRSSASWDLLFLCFFVSFLFQIIIFSPNSLPSWYQSLPSVAETFPSTRTMIEVLNTDSSSHCPKKS